MRPDVSKTNNNNIISQSDRPQAPCSASTTTSATTSSSVVPERSLERNTTATNINSTSAEPTQSEADNYKTTPPCESSGQANRPAFPLTRTLIPPSNSLVRQYIMGASTTRTTGVKQSNLTTLLQRHEQEQRMHRDTSTTTTAPSNEADSASGPSVKLTPPETIDLGRRPSLSSSQPPLVIPSSSQARALLSSNSNLVGRSMSEEPQLQLPPDTTFHRPRRCMSSKELGTLAPPSGSPYAYMLYKKEVLEATMRQRLQERRESAPRSQSSSPPLSTSTDVHQHLPSIAAASDLDSSTGSQCREGAIARMTNERRNRRRAEHNQAVIADLCEIVADLFVAEAKLLNPSNYGFMVDDETSSAQASASSVMFPGNHDHQLTLQRRRRRVLQSVQAFVSSLPTRYALGVETPSEVLVHMRLMAAVRTDDTKAVVHIVNLDESSETNVSHDQFFSHQRRHYTLSNSSSRDSSSTTTTGTSTINNYKTLRPTTLTGLTPQVSHPELRFSATTSASSSSASLRKSPSVRQRSLRLVTIACGDADGLLEYITKLLSTGGSRVLDADVMLSRDNVALDRFVVEMNGRLRLDKLANYIEAFLKDSKQRKQRLSSQSQLKSGDNAAAGDSPDRDGDALASISSSSSAKPRFDMSLDKSNNSSVSEPSGPLYVHPPSRNSTPDGLNLQDKIQEEMESAIPLARALASGDIGSFPMRGLLSSSSPMFPPIRREQSMPLYPPPSHRTAAIGQQQTWLTRRISFNGEPRLDRSQSSSQREEEKVEAGRPNPATTETTTTTTVPSSSPGSMRHRRPLVNREGMQDLDWIGRNSDDDLSLDFVTVPSWENSHLEGRVIPLIPFEDLMLIENLGMGRVSTIYRAAWRRNNVMPPTTIMTTATMNPNYVQMVALKVAMVNPETRDNSNVDELRREADIAARLQHPNVIDLVGVAADADCFCLAFDFCEGGSLLTLLSDTTRYYEYLPIALDVANGMAYLHSRNVIHRDLKPSNILLTKDHRAKIADFGMSVNFSGQELTAETGTYRYMAPEVIRHESYSSNADVYSFGICLWQLITREVPFATMTPIQAAYSVAEGRRPEIPESTPRRLQEIIQSCWDQDSHKRPSFTYIAMALADYAKMAFSPANVGAQTLHIANEMLASVEGNSTVNVDFSTLVSSAESPQMGAWLHSWHQPNNSGGGGDSASLDGTNTIGLEI